MSIKLTIGLGNSEPCYALTRHNTGAIVLGELASRCNASLSPNKYCKAFTAKCEIANLAMVLAFADGYMNLSGQALSQILRFFKIGISETAVIYDDITLDVGRMKISVGGSSGGHNGIVDIMTHCGNEFARIRIGVGAKPDKRMDLADYVLSPLPADSLSLIRAVDIYGCMSVMTAKGVEAAQNLFNRRAGIDGDK